MTLAAFAWRRGQRDWAASIVGSVGWAQRDPGWVGRIRSVPVRALPYRARVELLDALGIEDPAVGEAIAQDCDGVPYLLHLAREAASTASTYARIEERFLHHVDPDMVKILQLLSVARSSTETSFVRSPATTSFGPTPSRGRRSSRTRSSRPRGADTVQMHQLMARATQSRLSPGVLTELHELLRDIWRDRALQSPSVTAWREAALHAASAQPADTASLLAYADCLASAGKPGLDSMRTDLNRR